MLRGRLWDGLAGKGRDVRQRSFEQAEVSQLHTLSGKQQFHLSGHSIPRFHAPFAAWLGRSALVG